MEVRENESKKKFRELKCAESPLDEKEMHGKYFQW